MLVVKFKQPYYRDVGRVKSMTDFQLHECAARHFFASLVAQVDCRVFVRKRRALHRPLQLAGQDGRQPQHFEQRGVLFVHENCKSLDLNTPSTSPNSDGTTLRLRTVCGSGKRSHTTRPSSSSSCSYFSSSSSSSSISKKVKASSLNSYEFCFFFRPTNVQHLHHVTTHVPNCVCTVSHANNDHVTRCNAITSHSETQTGWRVYV